MHTLKQDNELILHEEFDNGWASITYTENDLSYTGFVSQKYLKKGDEIILEIEGFSTSNKIIFFIALTLLIVSTILAIRKNSKIKENDYPIVLPILSSILFSLIILLFFSKGFWLVYFLETFLDNSYILVIAIGSIFFILSIIMFFKWRKTYRFTILRGNHYILFIMIALIGVLSLSFLINFSSVGSISNFFSLENSFSKGYIFISLVNYTFLFFAVLFFDVVISKVDRKYIAFMLFLALVYIFVTYALIVLLVFIAIGIVMIFLVILGGGDRDKKYRCTKCNAQLIAKSKPTDPTCPVGGSHNWIIKEVKQK